MKRIILPLFVASVALFLFSLANLSPGLKAAADPKTVEVFGTVDVGNFPPVRANFVGFTTSEFPEGTGMLILGRVCNLEVPGTRLCTSTEILKSIPSPSTSQAGGTLMMLDQLLQNPVSSCISSDGVFFDCPLRPYPAACCG